MRPGLRAKRRRQAKEREDIEMSFLELEWAVATNQRGIEQWLVDVLVEMVRLRRQHEMTWRGL